MEIHSQLQAFLISEPMQSWDKLPARNVYMSVGDIESKLKNISAGSHLIVGINRRLLDGRPISCHWFNVFYDGQKICTLEG